MRSENLYRECVNQKSPRGKRFFANAVGDLRLPCLLDGSAEDEKKDHKRKEREKSGKK